MASPHAIYRRACEVYASKVDIASLFLCMPIPARSKMCKLVVSFGVYTEEPGPTVFLFSDEAYFHIIAVSLVPVKLRGPFV